MRGSAEQAIRQRPTSQIRAAVWISFTESEFIPSEIPPHLVAAVVNVRDGGGGALADVLAFDFADDGEQVHKQRAADFKRVDAVADADQIDVLRAQDVFVDFAEVAHGARQAV